MALFTGTNLVFIQCLQAPLLPRVCPVFRTDETVLYTYACIHSGACIEIPLGLLLPNFRFITRASFLRGSVNKWFNCAVRKAVLILEWSMNCQPLFNISAFPTVLINLSMVTHFHLHKLLCRMGSLLKNMQNHVFWPCTDYPSSLKTRLS